MSRIDYDVWVRLNQRFSSAELDALDALQDPERNYPSRCPFVEALRGVPRDPEWFVVPADYVGETRRGSTHPPRPFSEGRAERRAGEVHAWSAVEGECGV